MFFNSAALKNSDACLLFYRAIREHGYENFTFEVLEVIITDQKGIDEREIFWIKELNSTNTEIGMNVSPGGGGRANPNNTDTHKQCHKCGEIKLRTEFNKERCRHDGVRTYCKPCGLKMDQEYRKNLSEEELNHRNEVRRDNYALDPIKQIEQSKKYYEEHKEERAEYKKVYNQENIEKITLKNKENYAVNSEERKKQAKQDRVKSKEENSKLTKEEIFARTPIKFCNGCEKDIDSINFYIDLTRIDALGNRCKECHKANMAKNREKARNST